MDDLRLERALRQGPPFRTHYRPLALALESEAVVGQQRVAPRIAFNGVRARSVLLLLGLLALLVAAAFAAISLGSRHVQGGLLIVDGGSLYVVSSSGERDLVAQGDANQPITTARWSPDGSSLAYIRGGGLFVVSRGGSETRLIRTATGSDTFSRAEWSPDATRLALLRLSEPESGSGVRSQLLILDRDGRQLAVYPAVNGDHELRFAWSSDNQLAVLAGTQGAQSIAADVTLDVLARNGSVTYSADLPTGFEFARDLLNVPSWSPDGRFIALSGCVCRGAVSDSQIWIADTQSKEVRPIPNANAAFDHQPVWTADGTILFARNRPGTSTVWEVRPDGSGARSIGASHSEYLWEILPAPDARYVALVGTRGDDVEIVDAQQGQEIARVTLDHASLAVRWSLDGQHLWIAEAGQGPNGEGNLVEVDLDGHQTRRIAQEVGDFDVVYAK